MKGGGVMFELSIDPTEPQPEPCVRCGCQASVYQFWSGWAYCRDCALTLAKKKVLEMDDDDLLQFGDFRPV